MTGQRDDSYLTLVIWLVSAGVAFLVLGICLGLAERRAESEFVKDLDVRATNVLRLPDHHLYYELDGKRFIRYRTSGRKTSRIESFELPSPGREMGGERR